MAEEGRQTAERYLRARSLGEALGLLADGGAQVLAGGTYLVGRGSRRAARLVDLGLLRLDYVTEGEAAVRCGAMTSLQELSQSELLGRAGLGALAEAAHATRPSWMLRNMSTVGGELVEQSRHCALAVALLALDAEVRLATTEGERQLSLDEFGRAGWGAPAVLVEVVIPKPEARARTSFRRLAQLPSSEPIATAAVSLSREGGRVVRARAALGSSVETARRLPPLERALVGVGPAVGDKDLSDACRAGLEGVAFAAGPDDSPAYLREMSAVLLKRTCVGLLKEENGDED